MKPSVICHLSDFSPEYPGSFVDSLLSLSRYCRQVIGLETVCIFPEQATGLEWLELFDAAKVKYHFVPRKRNIVFPLRRLLQDYQPLIFHSHFETYDLSAIALKMLFYKKSKVVWHFHSIAQMTPRQRLKDLLKVSLLARNYGDMFIPVGDGAYQNAIERGFPTGKIQLNNNGVNTSRFSPDTIRREDTRVSLRASDDEIVFLSLGWSPIIKGIDILVKAISKFKETQFIQDSLFVIIGRDETKEFLLKYPELSKLGETLRLLAPTSNFPALLDGIDVLVAPSRKEAFSYAVIEAMAMGKLVICSDIDIPAVRSTVGKSEGVWLFPSEDWNMLAELLRQINQLSQSERERLGQANLQHVKANFSQESWAIRMVKLYTQLLNR